MSATVTTNPVPTWKKFQERINMKPRYDDILENLIPSTPGYSLLAGRAGLSKTNLGIQLAFAVSTGTPFLGFKTKKTPTVLLEFDGNEFEIKDRIDKIKTHFPDPGDNLRMDVEGIDSVIKHMKIGVHDNLFESYMIGCGFVVIDCLRSVVYGDYGQVKIAAQFVDQFNHLLDKCNAHAIIIMHVPKPHGKEHFKGDDLLYMPKGPTDYVDGVKGCAMVFDTWDKRNKIQGVFDLDAIRTLTFPKQRIAKMRIPERILTFNRDTLMHEECTVLVKPDGKGKFTRMFVAASGGKIELEPDDTMSADPLSGN